MLQNEQKNRGENGVLEVKKASQIKVTSFRERSRIKRRWQAE